MVRSFALATSMLLMGCLTPVGDADAGAKDAGHAPDAAIAVLSAPFPAVVASTRPMSVVAADFDGDGRPDVAVADAVGGAFTAAVRVLGNRADAGFVPLWSHLTDLSNAVFVRLILTGDGLAVLDMNSSSVTRLEADGGWNGVFAPVNRPGGSGLVTADFDGDGRADFAVLSANEARVAFTQADGGFRFSPALFEDPNAPVDLTAGDFDGDGHADLAVAIYGDGRLLTVAAASDGGFLPAKATPMKFGSYAVLAVDLNKDGVLDLVVGNRLTGVSSLLGQGDGTFQAPVETPGFGVVALAAADFDGDGNLEIAAVDYDADRIVITEWSGASLEIRGAHPMADAPRALAVADFNLDGRPDLAVACDVAGHVALLFDVGH